MSVGVCWCLFIHGGDKGVSGGRVGVSEGCLGGVGRYLSAIFGNWKRTDVFWVLSLCSMEP